MFPEKEIVGMWLNAQGYLVVNDINAGKKVIDALALKVEKGQLIEAVHVEVAVSVTGFSSNFSEISNKFEDLLVKKTIGDYINKFTGKKEYKSMVVVNASSIENPGHIKVVSFEKVLAEVLAGLDTQNYNNPTVRTLQLVNFLMLSNPNGMAYLMKMSNVSRQTKEKIIENILCLPATKRVFAKVKDSDKIEECFSVSPIAKPEYLANFIINNFTTRSFNMFLKELFKHDKAKAFTTKTSPNQKPLSVFIE